MQQNRMAKAATKPNYTLNVHIAALSHQVVFRLNDVSVTRTQRPLIYFYGSDVMLLHLQDDKHS